MYYFTIPCWLAVGDGTAVIEVKVFEEVPDRVGGISRVRHVRILQFVLDEVVVQFRVNVLQVAKLEVGGAAAFGKNLEE